MTITSTKIQKTSDFVYQELIKQGFSKYFNWMDYHYFKKLAIAENLRGFELINRIVFYFVSYNNELSDYADYEF